MRDYRQCPFNARHVVPKPEFDYHIQICEDRGRFEAEQLRGTITDLISCTVVVSVMYRTVFDIQITKFGLVNHDSRPFRLLKRGRPL